MRSLIWICIALFTVAMAGVSYAAHQIVGHFGVIGGLLTIAAMYGAARYFEQRQGKEEESTEKPIMAVTDHYATLGVARDADPEVVRAAYRALAKKYHPDTSPDKSSESSRRFRQVSEAHSVLSDFAQRARYDESLENGDGETHYRSGNK